MWMQLTPATLLASLSGAESARLATVSLGDGQTNALDEIALNVAREWRSGIRRVSVCDVRDGYVPDELIVHILADYRYRAFTRLPGMSDLLDNLRVDEWRRANTVRDNLTKVSIVAPDAAYAETAEQSGKASPAMSDPDTDSVLGF